ncbi:5-formyltetrahydrofolate cyclo-ligase [Hafnia alvei]|uniref:5-formyltetrahydrofolate cyclo-ligase n=1 Tax=Hafnia alvei TaxID=569 RepID=UPI0007BCA404|nr:5-formyltetrahydrofolate cyclo-ligase [Hafnia alvei]ANC39500.1 5-formyltetrahydrofolate cyclo-ligase [Hafnia alvei]STQ72406.1 5-formyltetrahydrofolate cyclo-ligase family protein [Hafnia alvei]
MSNNNSLSISSSNSGQSRSDIRSSVRQLRKNLSADFQHHAAQNIATRVMELPRVQNAHTVSLFLSFDGELNTRPLIERLWQAGKSIYLPVLHPFSRGNLLFLRYSAESEMVLNHFGIEEPRLNVQQVLPVSRLDIIFTPLVAFDATGQRLGMGGGFYDRTLQDWESAYLQQCGPYPIGLAHDCQRVDALPVQEWDVPLPEIITPSTHYRW